ncbi:MAG TPA: VWA domain-containing protein [Verrucomicrobiales bacterium]|jgi:Ca-activated chloride channel family protein|nr:VWA domain-containing protein [Verrucomicrobiales bacterium]
MNLLPPTYQFEQPEWFWALLVIPVLMFLKSSAGRQSVVQFGSLHLLGTLGKRTSSALWRIGVFLVFVTMVLGVCAMARLQKLTSEEKIEESGVEIFFALDLSLSMSIEDMFYEGENGQRQTVNRLTVAKNVVKNFIRNRISDRIGFVVFAGKPYLASPLTLDRNWLEDTLKKINFDRLRSQDTMGTAIGSGIATASTRLTSKESKSKIIILVTDGANNSGRLSPTEAANAAALLGIRIYTVAIGTYGRHVVPELRNMPGRGFGDDVRQEFDEETLKEVANITKGRFYLAKDAATMSNIFNEIDQLEKTKLVVRKRTLIDELYQWPLWGAVITGTLTLLLHQTLLRRYP